MRPLDAERDMCPDRLVCPGPVGWSYARTGVFTRVNGLAKESIIKVRVTRRSEGKTRYASTYLGHVKGYLLKRLRFPSEFAVFVSSFSGCPPPGRVWVEGFEDTGKPAVRVQAPNLVPSACERQGALQPNDQSHAVVTIR